MSLEVEFHTDDNFDQYSRLVASIGCWFKIYISKMHQKHQFKVFRIFSQVDLNALDKQIYGQDLCAKEHNK